MRQLRSLPRKYYVRQVIACWMMCFMLLGMTPVRIAKADLPPGQLPAGWEVVTGSVGGFDYSTTNELHIRNIANGTIIKWNGGFNIGSSAWTEFQLINSGASVLNRDVTGSMSQIYGKLTSNGQVWIVNPAGVLFGKGATINVNGLVASALNITNENFLNGQHEFNGGNGSIINRGNISAQSVYLVGKQVTNVGNIQCPDGYVVMAAADKVYLGQPGGNIAVEIGSLVPPNTEQTQLPAQVTNQGTVDAGSGTIILAAAGDALSRPIVSNLGTLSTSTIQGDAGNISLQANNGDIINAGEITAISDSGIGGTVTADADQMVNSGTVDVSGLQGGTVDILATSHLEQAGNIHADGFGSNGGNINLTADAEVVLKSESLTTANAGTNGDGGNIVAYSPQLALFEENAQIQAKGGDISGNGGFVELSGLEGAMVGGFADLSAPAGQAGTFLLDPHDVTISQGDNSYDNVNISWLENQLGIASVTVDTVGDGEGDGDITVVDAIGLDNPWIKNNLTLNADDDIFVNAKIINIGTGDLYLFANGDITTKELTTTAGNILVHSTGGDLVVNGDITADRIPTDELGGGVSLIADEGKIYTEGGSNDTLNVSITGYSDDNQNVGVYLPKSHDDNSGKFATLVDGQSEKIEIYEEPVGKAAIVIMSDETLKLGSNAELTANGEYYPDGSVDDRPGVDFLDEVEGPKNPGEPIDVAIYLASNAGNVKVDSPVAIESSGVMVIDAYDTVEDYGADFIASLGGIYWLEACSRITTDLAFAQTNGTIPYAGDTGLFPGPGQYVLRGENPDVGTGAWELEAPPVEETEEGPTLPLKEIVEASKVDPPVTPEIEDTGQTIGDRGFDDMQWMANELGLCDGDEQGEDENLCQEITQAYLAGAFLQATDLRPYRAATRLRDLVEILHDDDGTRIAGLIRAVNEFSQPEMPPSPEQFASIAQSFADHSNDGTHYAAA